MKVVFKKGSVNQEFVISWVRYIKVRLYQVNYFINGLLPIFVSQVVIANPNILNAAIERAKLVKTGIKYTLQNVDMTTPTNQQATATKAITDLMEDLTK